VVALRRPLAIHETGSGRHDDVVHSSVLCQHAADDRDADIARALDAMLGPLTEPPDDTERPE
jgi:hypothetical protein